MTPSGAELALLALAGTAAGTVNALAGGGTLITFPALTAVGVPALAANVTNTVALLPGFCAGTIAQRADLTGQGRRVRVAAPAAIAGGVLGGVLLLSTGEALFATLVPWLLLAATALIAAEPWVRRAAARRLQAPPPGAPEHPARVGLVALAGAVYGGYFGAGLGIILLALFSLVLPDSLRRVNALKQAVSLTANATAAVLFALTAGVVWPAAAVIAAGALVGGALGGRLAGRIPATVLRAVIVAVCLVVATVFFVR